MAVGTGYPKLAELERSWFQTHLTGATPQTSINQLKKDYYLSQVGSGYSKSNSLAELEQAWLKKVIVDNGGTSNQTYDSELWAEVVRSSGKTPSKFINQNKIVFFSTTA